MKELQKIYKEWTKLNNELGCSIDCGEQRVREDFSNFAELENEILFDEMLVLENNL